MAKRLDKHRVWQNIAYLIYGMTLLAFELIFQVLRTGTEVYYSLQILVSIWVVGKWRVRVVLLFLFSQ